MRTRRRGLKAVALLGVVGVSLALATGSLNSPANAAPTRAAAAAAAHTQESYSPYSNFTAKWTRADAMKIMDRNDNSAPPGSNSLDEDLTMPEIPADFPVMKDGNGKQVWVWDTWPLTDEHGNQYSYKGWDVIFSLTADPYAGYTFDDRHVHARIGFWFRPANANPEKVPWKYGGHVFGDQTPSTQAEWSGSTRIFGNGQLKMFYTHLNFADRNKPIAQISLATGGIHADNNHVWFSGFRGHKVLLEPDGKYYQTPDQNPYFSFRDPFTFQDPKYPNKTFMVFEGNTAGTRGSYKCQQSDLGNSGEVPIDVTNSGANYQMANIGLAVADNKALSKWSFLPPILSGNCVNDQTERPQFVIKKSGGQWKYYLFTISHAFTYAAGLRGPDGVYGFVGNGIRSDFQPLNKSGLALGNPSDLNRPATDSQANTRQFQAYSHYVMPGGYVESFIDNVDGRRGGTLAPTVKLNISGAKTSVDRNVGQNGLLPYGWIPSNVDISPVNGAMRASAKKVVLP